MRLGTVAWLLAGVVGCATAGPTAPQNSPPPPRDMDPARALGLWQSNFGAVKIEPNAALGGIAAGAVHGVWQYDRRGQDVIGYFYGTLRGNVLSFRWQEPGNPPLGGEGFIAFDAEGQQYSGRWWSASRDRAGLWNGGRQPVQPYAPNPIPAPDPQQNATPQAPPLPPGPPGQPLPPGQPSPSGQPLPQGPQGPPPQSPLPAPSSNSQAPVSPYPATRPQKPGPQQPPTYY